MQAVLAATLDLETRGGQLLADGSRRRTPGGVFFGLLRAQVSLDEWRHIRGASASPAQPLALSLDWAERAASAQSALAEPGLATTARLTVVGRPLEVKAREGLMIVTIAGGDTLPALPRGLPHVEHATTTYKVCVLEQAWRHVESALDGLDSLLIADGYAIPNGKAGSVTVLAHFVTAKLALALSGVMRAQLIGRPGRVIHHGLTTLMALTSRQALRLPEALAEPPPVTYLVYSAEKKWRSIGAARQQAPETALRIDGYCFYDPERRCCMNPIKTALAVADWGHAPT